MIVRSDLEQRLKAYYDQKIQLMTALQATEGAIQELESLLKLDEEPVTSLSEILPTLSPDSEEVPS